MSAEIIDHLDRIIGQTPCRLSFAEIADYAFGGLARGADIRPVIGDIIQAGIGLRKHENLQLAAPLPPEIGFFFIAWAVEKLEYERIQAGDMGLDKVRRRMEKIERKHGVEDGLVPWHVNEGPLNWQVAYWEWGRIADKIFADTLRPHAEDMAELFTEDPDEFERRHEIGRQNFARLLGRDDLLMPLEDVIAEVREDD
jgi:hypothetical protein